MFRLKVSVSEKASLFYLRMCIFVRQHLFFVWLRMRMIRESALFRLWEWNKIADCPCENAGSRETSLSLRMHLFETTWHHLQRMLRTVGEPFCLISFIWDNLYIYLYIYCAGLGGYVLEQRTVLLPTKTKGKGLWEDGFLQSYAIWASFFGLRMRLISSSVIIAVGTRTARSSMSSRRKRWSAREIKLWAKNYHPPQSARRAGAKGGPTSSGVARAFSAPHLASSSSASSTNLLLVVKHACLDPASWANWAGVCN